VYKSQAKALALDAYTAPRAMTPISRAKVMTARVESSGGRR